ncbi:MAG: response regulator [Lachnospiraceae bacterium]|nr:response regulator [Lachnospiraceae bacterium]
MNELKNRGRHLIEHILQFQQENGKEKGINDIGKTDEIIQFMEEMPGGFLIYYADKGEEIIYANKGLVRIFGCETLEEFRELTGNSFRGMVHPEDLDTVEESIQMQIAASQYDLDYVEYRIFCKDGSIRWIEDYGHFVHDEVIGDIFYVFLGDATDKKNQQETEKVLEETMGKANLAVSAKNTFLANISHDMRTPLNAIFGYTSLAKMNMSDIDTTKKYLEQIEVASKKLLDMIEKVLQVSALSNAAGPKEVECDLCGIVQEVYDFLLPQAQEKDISFLLNCEEVRHTGIYADQEQLKQLVLNLINNAVTYTKPGGNVRISLSEGRELPHHEAVYSFVVEDNGIGISPEFLESVFEPFVREKNSTLSGIHSIGLGLTIAKSIVDMMGGTIDVKSTVGEGTTFTVTFRFRAQPLSGDASENTATSHKVNQRLLLVEDNEINRELETELLENMGFLVDSAENGQIAVEIMKRTEPGDYDVIIMDIQMPVMNGWEAAAAIRKLPNPMLAQIPIIALSANAFESDQLKSRKSGMDVHLTKPVNFSELLDTIEQLTAQSQIS